MEKFISLLTFENITEGIKKSYEKYKIANSSFWVESLSFNTILALAPILAILFSLGSWFGAKDYLLEQLVQSTPLPKDAVDLISTFADNALKNARSGVLAGIGFLFLGWTFISMFSLIERSFNDIWHIKETRTFIRKVSDYISFFIFLPLFFVIINGLLLFLMSKVENISILYEILSKVLPYTSLLIFLGALYMVMPNTSVKFVPAMSSAFVISVIFSIFQFLFIKTQSLISSYSVIYGSFSVIFIFLLWIRVSWFFIILGVHLTYLFQNVNFDINLEGEIVSISFNSRLYLTLKILEEMVKKYVHNEPPITFSDLKNNIRTSSFLLEITLQNLVKADYLIVGYNSNNEKIYSITKNIDEVKLDEVYNLVARSGEEIFILRDQSLDKIENIIFSQDYDRTLRSLGGE
nr:YihY/virulence factor BrkB family protein [Fusobacterium russii]